MLCYVGAFAVSGASVSLLSVLLITGLHCHPLPPLFVVFIPLSDDSLSCLILLVRSLLSSDPVSIPLPLVKCLYSSSGL